MLFYLQVALKYSEKESIDEFDINSLSCVTLIGFTWFCGLKYTCKNLQTHKDKEIFMLIEQNIRGGFSSVSKDRM